MGQSSSDVSSSHASRRRFLQLAGSGLIGSSLSCLSSGQTSKALGNPVRLTEPEQQTWWIPSDPHVGHRDEDEAGQHLRTAIEDVNTMDDIDYAVMMGDLLEDDYKLAEPFVRLMNQLKVRWTYVLGNHDFDVESQRPVLPVHFSGRTVLGIRFIFLSTEAASHVNRDLVINEEQERWFWNELATHRDKPIFMFTHQPHWEFDKWNELRNVLHDYNIVAWFSGHKHRWDVKDSGHGFVQVNMHSIGGFREDDMSSFLRMHRQANTVDVRVSFRHHVRKEWIAVNDGQREVTLSVDLS